MIHNRMNRSQPRFQSHYQQQPMRETGNSIFNKSAYAFGGISNVRALQQSAQGNPRASADEYNMQMPASAYVGKRQQQKLNRVKSASSNKLNSGLAQMNAKTFYPEGYFKRVGYQKDANNNNGNVQLKSDTLGQLVRERFNEDLADQRSVYSKASGNQ